MFAYIHKKCGKPAWLLHHEPTPGKTFLSQQCYSLENKPINFTTGCRCQSCGEVMFEDAARDSGVVVKVTEREARALASQNTV